MRLQYLEQKDGGWSYRLVSKGRILVHSESYVSINNAERALENFLKSLDVGKVFTDEKIDYIYLNELTTEEHFNLVPDDLDDMIEEDETEEEEDANE